MNKKIIAIPLRVEQRQRWKIGEEAESIKIKFVFELCLLRYLRKRDDVF